MKIQFLKSQKSKVALIGLAALMGSTTASAALPAEAEAAMTAIGTLITDFIAAGWPIVVSLVVGVIGIKLFKKFSGKVS